MPNSNHQNTTCVVTRELKLITPVLFGKGFLAKTINSIMEKLVGLGVFGTFGNPNGFQKLFYHNAKFQSSLDLSGNAFELYPNSELFVVKKENIGGVHSICYGVYTYVREFQSNRRGTFIGNCIVTNGYLIDGNLIFECLKEFHVDTISNQANVINNTLQVQDIKNLIIQEPTSFNKIVSNARTYNNNQNIDNNRSFFIGLENYRSEQELKNFIEQFFNKAVNSFPNIGTFYFSANKEVINFVREKGLVTPVNWAEFAETKNNQESTKKNNQSSKKNYQEKQPKSISQFDSKSNQQSNNNLPNYWNIPHSNWNAEEIKKRVEEYNKLVDTYISLHSQSLTNKKKDDMTLFNKVASFLTQYYAAILITLMTFLTVFLLYFLVRRLKDDDTVSINDKPQKIERPREIRPEPVVMPSPSPSVNVLSPISNGFLPQKDINILSGKKIKGKAIEYVIEQIFNLNPTDIESHYKGQESMYAKKLVELNRECFREYNGKTVCFCEELQTIPIYK